MASGHHQLGLSSRGPNAVGASNRSTTPSPSLISGSLPEEKEEDDPTVPLLPQEHEEEVDVFDKFKRACLVTSHVLALLAVVCVIWWIHLLGGLSWKEGDSKHVFNWHPLLMVLAFCFMTVSALSFRVPLSRHRPTTKLMHGIGWTVASASALVAMIAVFKSHNDAVSGFIANLYSLHSWIGCGLIVLYVAQFVVGTFAFGLDTNFTARQKATILKFHQFVGPFIYIATAATILLGIQEKEGFVGCSYHVKSADYFPPQHFLEIPYACRVSHLLGLVVFVMALTTSFALFSIHQPSSPAVGFNQA